MKSQYVATLRQNPGRQALSVEFRHPLRPDPSNQGKPGRKVRKGLGTDRVAAERLVAELNGLLADPTLHSPAARAKAEEIFKDPRIVEIFYDGIEPKRENYRDLRNDHLPFPPREDGYPRILLIGVPGAGKTTLVRQLIGSHPVRDRFPSTSVNRTTTFETEIIAGATQFSAAVTFMSEEETDFEIRQSVSAAILRSVDDQNTDARVAKSLLERSDMRFRLKYILGDWPNEESDVDPYEAEESPNADEHDNFKTSENETEQLAIKLRKYVTIVRRIAAGCKVEVQKIHGTLSSLSPDERNKALDQLQDLADKRMLTRCLLARSSMIYGSIRTGFFRSIDQVNYGMARLWLIKEPSSACRAAVSCCSSIFSASTAAIGRATVLHSVNGIRVAGPFAPIWADGNHKIHFYFD